VDLGAYEFQGSSTGVPPYIISPPASQSTTVGAGASFNVFAGGSSPLQYQWIFNGGNITGATASSLILTNVQLSQSGTYTVAITNIAGSNTSSDAVLAVYLPGTRYVDVNSANPTVPYTNWSHAARRIQDAIDVAAPGDELVVTNGIYASGGRAVSGSMTNRAALYKPLTLHSVNGPQFTIIQGRQVPGTTNGDGAIRCAYLTNGATLSGFTLTNGATRTAGDGNFEKLGGGLWCENSGTVSNCVLVNNSAVGGGGMLGGALDNCALVGNSAWFGGATVGGTLRNCTLIGNSATDEGGGAWNSTLNNCSLIGNSASNSAGGAWLGTLTNCTLRNNWAASGGGVYIGTLVNCTLTSNWATNGGGAADATLINCLLAGNSASDSGGGALSGTLVNCTLTANSAGVQGGGVGARYSSDSSALTNCIVYFNTSPFGANFNPTNTALNYCCTTPLPSGGNGNIINDPLFVDQAGGNLRLQSNSPCIDAGNNTYAPAGPDLDGHPRITGSSVDIGAYEFYPSPSLRIATSPGNVTLAWQLWGSNFVLQCVSSLPSTPGGWSNVSAQVIVVGGENAATLPANHSSKYFRLSLP
jgi:hypothetical protein